MLNTRLVAVRSLARACSRRWRRCSPSRCPSRSSRKTRSPRSPARSGDLSGAVLPGVVVSVVDHRPRRTPCGPHGRGRTLRVARSAAGRVHARSQAARLRNVSAEADLERSGCESQHHAGNRDAPGDGLRQQQRAQRRPGPSSAGLSRRTAPAVLRVRPAPARRARHRAATASAARYQSASAVRFASRGRSSMSRRSIPLARLRVQ